MSALICGSLAFDTIFAEGQRRYVESLSAYARQFLQLMDKPDVDMIEGLSPAISIEQKATSHNPRSTVGTVTEIHDYLRLLYARAGTPYCPDHDLPLQSQTVSQMVDAVLALPEDTRLMLLAPVARARKGEFVELFAELQAQGYVRFRVDGVAHEFDDLPKLKKTEKHNIDVVIDRLKVRSDADPAAHDQLRQRLAESFEAALRLADGRALVAELDANPGADGFPATSAEHFFNANSAYSCAGAPLFGPDGRCAGMLDLTGVDTVERPELKHLVVQSARSIENALIQNRPHDLMIRLNWSSQNLGDDMDGMVCLDPDGWVTGANPAARQMVPALQKSDASAVHCSELFAMPYEMLFDAAKSNPLAYPQAIDVPLWSGLRLHAQPLLHGRAPAAGRLGGRGAPAPTLQLKDIETALIRKAVSDARGNIMKAARALGISRATVYRRLGEKPK